MYDHFFIWTGYNSNKNILGYIFLSLPYKYLIEIEGTHSLYWNVAAFIKWVEKVECRLASLNFKHFFAGMYI